MRLVVAAGMLLATLAAGCSRATTSPPEVQPGQEAIVQPGSAVRIVGTPIRLTVERIAESRCPSDVTCVWAGEAEVALHLAGVAPERRDTLRMLKPPRATTYGGYEIALVDVKPYPLSTAMQRAPYAIIRVTRQE